MVLSSAIAEVCFHMIADDRRPYCDLRSAIRDHMETSLKRQEKENTGKSLLVACGSLKVCLQLNEGRAVRTKLPRNKMFKK